MVRCALFAVLPCARPLPKLGVAAAAAALRELLSRLARPSSTARFYCSRRTPHAARAQTPAPNRMPVVHGPRHAAPFWSCGGGPRRAGPMSLRLSLSPPARPVPPSMCAWRGGTEVYRPRLLGADLGAGRSLVGGGAGYHPPYRWSHTSHVNGTATQPISVSTPPPPPILREPTKA